MHIWWEGCASRLKNTKKYSNIFFSLLPIHFSKTNRWFSSGKASILGRLFLSLWITYSTVQCSIVFLFRHWILRVRTVERKASWGLFHLAVAKPRHTRQSIHKVWPHTGWQTTKMCGLVTVRPPPTQTLYPSLPLKMMIHQAKLWETQLGNAPSSGDHSETWGQKCI